MTKTSTFQYAILVTTATFIGAFVAMVFFVLPSSAHAATLTGEMSVGSDNANVTSLQTFLATNSLVYPAGLVTGYYGALTQTAVTQFQIAYGIPAVGNVGPITMARINSIMASGAGLDVSAPQVSTIQIARNPGEATLSWTTNEETKAVLYYSTTPVISYETSVSLTDPVTTGTPVSDQVVSTAHSIALSGLQPGQTYYYIAHSTDLTGNVTITLTGSFVSE